MSDITARSEQHPTESIRYRSTLTWQPQEDLGTVVLKARWVADNGVETAVFPTLDDARRFAHNRWRHTDEQIKVIWGKEK